MFKQNDYVCWQASVKGITYDRAGRIEIVVPAYKKPRDYVPNSYIFYGVGKPRNTVSFLISVPGTKTLFWPDIERLQSLGLDQWSLLYEQKLKTKSRCKDTVDKSDRIKLRTLCLSVCGFFGDKFYENEDFLVVPGWGRRFWFGIRDNKEYIKEIENFTPVQRV